jgi:membrane dipeptidase
MADCHNDLLSGCLHQHERGVHDPFGDFWLPQLRAGGVVLQVLPVFTEEQFVGEGALRRAFMVIEEAWRIASMHAGDVSICLSGAQIKETIDSGRIALILALEGSEPVGHTPELLRPMFRSGVRMVSLTWNRRSMMADGVGEHDAKGALTRIGVEAVTQMEELGIVVDVSHLSEAGFWHLNEVATRPFVASHSSCRTLHDHARNLTDDQIRAIARSGGFVAMNAFGAFLADNPSVRDYAHHARHARDLVGADHVALGLDFMADLIHTVDPILGGALVDLNALPVIPDLQRPADLAQLGDVLVDELGEADARWVASRTMIESLSALLPQGATMGR